MKKLIVVVLSYLMIGASFAGDDVWVSVRNSVVRDKPSFLGGVVARVKYQQQLELLNDDQSWWQVSVDGKQGWIHSSALSETLTLKEETEESSSGFSFNPFSGGDDSNAKTEENGGREITQDEITLAGKGFNKDVEKAYSEDSDQLNYKAVDVMENRSLNGFSVASFAADGGLTHMDPESLDDAFKEENSSGGSNIEGLFQ